MNHTHNKSSVAQQSLFDRLQQDVNCILTDISRHLSDEDEEIAGLHFDVDLVLKRQVETKRHSYISPKKGHGRIVPQLRADHELNHYNPNFHKAHIPDSSRRPLGRLTHAAQFFLR